MPNVRLRNRFQRSMSRVAPIPITTALRMTVTGLNILPQSGCSQTSSQYQVSIGALTELEDGGPMNLEALLRIEAKRLGGLLPGLEPQSIAATHACPLFARQHQVMRDAASVPQSIHVKAHNLHWRGTGQRTREHRSRGGRPPRVKLRVTDPGFVGFNDEDSARWILECPRHTRERE